MDNSYGVIYCLTSPTGKFYIGMTTDYAYRMATYSCARCKRQPYLYQAIVKHGWENFKQEIIAVGYSRAELEQLEIDAIRAYNSTDTTVGYNLACGGIGGQAGRKRSPETCAKIALSKRNVSAETRAKMGLAKRNMSAENRAKISNTLKGHVISDITRAKLSAAKKAHYERKRRARLNPQQGA